MSKKTKKLKGFILIEILVSLLLLATGILFLINSLSVITKSNRRIRSNRTAYMLIDNVYNQLYSGEYIPPGKVSLDNQEYFWSLTVNDTGDGLKNLVVNVKWGKGSLTSTAGLSHSAIDVRQ